MIGCTSFLAENPSAVLVLETGARSRDDWPAFEAAGEQIVEAMLARCKEKESHWLLKPNVVHATRRLTPRDYATVPEMDPVETAGVVTNPHFVGGVAAALRRLGARAISLVEGGYGADGNLAHFEDRGYLPIAERLGLELVSTNLARPGEDRLHWIEVEGVILRRLPVARPVGDADARLVSLPAMKTHNLAIISLAIKNLQGVVAVGFKEFCKEVNDPECHPGLEATFVPEYREILQREVHRHRQLGFFGWQDPAQAEQLERYCQRALDALVAIRPWLSMVEGVIGRDGTAFHRGQDWLCNVVVAGRNAVHVDAVCAYLMGHDPRRVPILRIARERGIGECDPGRIPIFLLQNGDLKPVEHTALRRTPLGVFYLGETSRYLFL